MTGQAPLAGAAISRSPGCSRAWKATAGRRHGSLPAELLDRQERRRAPVTATTPHGASVAAVRVAAVGLPQVAPSTIGRLLSGVQALFETVVDVGSTRNASGPGARKAATPRRESDRTMPWVTSGEPGTHRTLWWLPIWTTERYRRDCRFSSNAAVEPAHPLARAHERATSGEKLRTGLQKEASTR